MSDPQYQKRELVGGLGLKEALREENQFPINNIYQRFLRPDNTILEINRLLVYNGKLYAALGNVGEIWSHTDDAGWVKEVDLEQGTFWETEVFNDVLYFLGQTHIAGTPYAAFINASTKTIHPVGTEQHELFGHALYNGRLYLGTDTGRILSTADMVNFPLAHTKPDGFGASSMAVLGNTLYVGSSRGAFAGIGDPYISNLINGRPPASGRAAGNCSGRIDTYNGAVWGAVFLPDVTESISSMIMSQYLNTDYLVVATHKGRIYLSPDGTTFNVFAKVAEKPDMMRLRPYGTDKFFLIVGERRGGGSIWIFDNGILTRLLKTTGFSPTDVTYYGSLLAGTAWWDPTVGWPGASGVYVDLLGWSDYRYKQAQASILNLGSMPMISNDPFPLKLWDSETVVDAGERTDPVPTAGFDRKTIYLYSDQAGSLDIEIDPGRDGNWRVFDTVAVAANTLESYLTTHDHPRLRLFFDPDAEATVEADIFLTNEV